MKKRTLAWILALALCLSSAPFSLASGFPFSPYNKDEALSGAIEALMQSVFTAQYDGRSSGYMVRWADQLRIFVDGAYTDEDLATTQRFIQSLNDRVIWLPNVKMASAPDLANITITFAKLDELAGFNLPGYAQGEWGSFSYWFDDNLINRARIIIASDVTTQEDRNYLLQMKLTNALGLTNRIPTFSDSIIAQGYTPKQNLSQVDWLTLNLLYELFLYPGIEKDEAYDNLNSAVNASLTPGSRSVAQTMGGLELTIEELAKYNGKNGQPAYVAVDGIIYDMTNSSAWRNGNHNGFEAGVDLTYEIKNVSPHGISKLGNVVEVGRLVTR